MWFCIVIVVGCGKKECMVVFSVSCVGLEGIMGSICIGV